MKKKKKIYHGEGWSFLPEAKTPQTSEEPAVSQPKEKQKIRIYTEKRKGNKMVTILGNIKLTKMDKKALAQELKTHCACGGTIHEESIEIQGDQKSVIIQYLKQNGWGLT